VSLKAWKMRTIKLTCRQAIMRSVYMLRVKNTNMKQLKPWLKAIIRFPVRCQFQCQYIVEPFELNTGFVTVFIIQWDLSDHELSPRCNRNKRLTDHVVWAGNKQTRRHILSTEKLETLKAEIKRKSNNFTLNYGISMRVLRELGPI
jgi:hypothetical protein